MTSNPCPRCASVSGPSIWPAYMLCMPFYIMLGLMVIEALLQRRHHVPGDQGRAATSPMTERLIHDLMMILAAQSVSYIAGAISWIYAERAGFLAYGRYMMQFARDNRHQTRTLDRQGRRERVEPFLTGETFHVYFTCCTRSKAICASCWR